MKAIVQTGKRSVEVQERPTPEPADDEVLISVHSAGLCGSDAHAYQFEDGYEWIPIPRIMGHEYAGTVVEIGRDVEGFEPGTKVVEEPIHHCGACFQCRNEQSNVCQNFSITGMHRDGAYTELVAVDPAHLHRVPEAVSLRAAAITEPTSIATRAVLDQSVVTAGDTILVEGPGPIGTLVAAVADSVGANVFVSGLEQDCDYRLPLVESLGVETITPGEGALTDAVDEATEGIGFDVVFDTTGHESGVEEAITAVRKGGQVVVVGLPGAPSEVFFTPVVRGEVDINSSYGSKWSNFEQALRLLENGSIDASAIVDTSHDVDEPAAAFDAFLNSQTTKPVFRFG